jgi:hypothetical protein
MNEDKIKLILQIAEAMEQKPLNDATIQSAATATFDSQKLNNPTFLTLGKYIIRTVTMIYSARIIAINETELLLDQVSWLADTGRFSTMLKTGQFDSNAEIEPYAKQVILSRACIVDSTPFEFDLPTKATGDDE